MTTLLWVAGCITAVAYAVAMVTIASLLVWAFKNRNRLK